MKAKVWVVRHGKRHDRIDRTWAESAERPLDTPLNDDGHSSAQETAEFLRSMVNGDKQATILYCSPYLRCMQTVEPFAEGMKAPVRVENIIGERVFRESEFAEVLPLEGLSKEFPGIIDLSYNSLSELPQYETEEEFFKRIERFRDYIRKVVKEEMAKHASHGGNEKETLNIIIYAHAAVMLAFTASMLDRLRVHKDAAAGTDAGRPHKPKLNRVGYCSVTMMSLAPGSDNWNIELNGSQDHVKSDLGRSFWPSRFSDCQHWLDF